MKFSFSGRHMEIGESLTTRAEEACETLAEKYDTEFLDVNIVMKKENHLFYTDIAVKSCKKALQKQPLFPCIPASRHIDLVFLIILYVHDNLQNLLYQA